MITQQDIDDFTSDALDDDSDDHCIACNDTGEGQAPDSVCPRCSGPVSRKYWGEP